MNIRIPWILITPTIRISKLIANIHNSSQFTIPTFIIIFRELLPLNDQMIILQWNCNRNDFLHLMRIQTVLTYSSIRTARIVTTRRHWRWISIGDIIVLMILWPGRWTQRRRGTGNTARTRWGQPVVTAREEDG